MASGKRARDAADVQPVTAVTVVHDHGAGDNSLRRCLFQKLQDGIALEGLPRIGQRGVAGSQPGGKLRTRNIPIGRIRRAEAVHTVVAEAALHRRSPRADPQVVIVDQVRKSELLQ